jgi:mannose-binding lectin 2
MSKAIFSFAFFFFQFITFLKSEKLEFHSFESPFTEVDGAGVRILSRLWRTHGSTVVNNNFIRLTPDRQSRKGAIWSKKSLGVNGFSSILKFRISGQAKTFFGDGLAMWIVQDSYYVEGDYHGSQERFVGVGIIFDTFKNTENLIHHRDVTIVVNDGEKTWEMMTEEVKGCNLNVRYQSTRDDFSIKDSSSVKVLINGTSFMLMVDIKSTGQWTQCASMSLPLPLNWAAQAHIGK